MVLIKIPKREKSLDIKNQKFLDEVMQNKITKFEDASSCDRI